MGQQMVQGFSLSSELSLGHSLTWPADWLILDVVDVIVGSHIRLVGIRGYTFSIIRNSSRLGIVRSKRDRSSLFIGIWVYLITKPSFRRIVENLTKDISSSLRGTMGETIFFGQRLMGDTLVRESSNNSCV